jgi:CubicO group peptidase (beta-lactamase class C family)
VRHCGRTSPYDPHYPYSLQVHVNTEGQIPDAPPDAYWKPGAGGHCLYVIPSMDLVAFKMGGRDDQYDPADTGLAPSPRASQGAKGSAITVDQQVAIWETLRQVVAAFR